LGKKIILKVPHENLLSYRHDRKSMFIPASSWGMVELEVPFTSADLTPSSFPLRQLSTASVFMKM